jgi:hypothetical protein
MHGLTLVIVIVIVIFLFLSSSMKNNDYNQKCENTQNIGFVPPYKFFGHRQIRDDPNHTCYTHHEFDDVNPTIIYGDRQY